MVVKKAEASAEAKFLEGACPTALCLTLGVVCKLWGE